MILVAVGWEEQNNLQIFIQNFIYSQIKEQGILRFIIL